MKITDLNYENNMEVFTSSVQGGKAFAAEQKIRELKSRIAKLNALEMKFTPTNLISNSEKKHERSNQRKIRAHSQQH